MENISLDTNTLMIIGGAVVLLILLLVFLRLRKIKKRKNGEQGSAKDQIVEKIEGKKYQTNEPTVEESEGAPKLILEKFDDGQLSLSFRFKVRGGKIKLDEIDPYDNPWIKVLNYNDLVGQTRSDGQILHVYFDRKIRKRPSRKEKAVISIVYREHSGKQWIQQIKYNSNSGAKLASLKTLN